MMHASAKDAQDKGFAVFNTSFQHLCVDVPDSNFTITAKTPDGKKVTFAFLMYQDGHGCVDIHHQHDGESVKNGSEDLPIQNVIVFGPGNNAFSTRRHMESNVEDTKVPTLIGLLLKPLK